MSTEQTSRESAERWRSRLSRKSVASAPEPYHMNGRLHCPLHGEILVNGRLCNDNQGCGWKEYAGCKRHILGHGSSKQYTCGLILKDGTACTFSSNHSATMFAHKNGGKHVDYDDYKFQCKVCYKRFPLRQGLERHMKKHSGHGRRSTRRALENVNTSFADPSYLDNTNTMCAVAPPPLPHGFEATENLPELPDVSGIDFPIDGYAMKPKTLLDSMNTLFPEHAYPSSGHTDHLLPDQQTMYSTVASTTQHQAELTAQPPFNVTTQPADFSNGYTLHNSVVPQEMGQFNVYDFGRGVAPEVFAEQQLLDNPGIHLEEPCIPNDLGACAAPPSNIQETQSENHDMMFPLHDAVLAYLTRECEDFLSTEDVPGTMEEHPNFTPCHERPSSGLPSISAMELSPSDFTFLNGEAPLR